MHIASKKTVPAATLLLAVGLVLVLLPPAPVMSQADEAYAPVPAAECGPDDRAETGLQGQVPWTERAQKFAGFNCNLELVGQYAGDGAGWQMAWYDDCAYYGGSTGRTPENGSPKPGQDDPGTTVIDASDPTNPKFVRRLTSDSMIDPWESLKVAPERGLLASVNANNGGGGPEFDIYDVSKDCTDPKLLASKTIGTSVGHAGSFSVDEEIYYSSPLSGSDANPKAIDIRNPRRPKLITEDFPVKTHDLSTNRRSNRMYSAVPGNIEGVSPGPNGLAILDVTQVQKRRKNPEIPVVGEVYWPDGGLAQMTQPITIKGKPYILFVDEGVAGASKWDFCRRGLPPYAFARLIDISDETKPKIASRLMLETHLPSNCAATVADSQGLFQYDSHYCTASDGKRDSTTGPVKDAVIVACGYFESGLRVFDVRDPANVREIAYYNPPAQPGYQTGSTSDLVGACHTADWTASHPRIRPKRGEIWFTSQCNGFQVVKFTNGIWPLKPLGRG